MPQPDEKTFKIIAQRFLPNGIGSLDGEHVRVQKIPHTGSIDFNYKHLFYLYVQMQMETLCQLKQASMEK